MVCRLGLAPAKLVAAGAAVALLAVAFYSVSGSRDEPPEDAPASGPLLAFRVGDVLVYREESGRLVQYEALPPRAVRGADFEWVEALPVVWSPEGFEPRPTTLVAMFDVERGGLAVSAFYCALMEDVGCEGEAYVAWQACAFNGVLGGPVSTLRVEDLANETVHVREPDGNTTWRYRVAWESPAQVRLALDGWTEPRSLCLVPEEVVVDARHGLIRSIKRGGEWMHLLRVEEGDGPVVRVGGAKPLAPARFVPPVHPRTHPYPPGAGELGTPEWTLAAAFAKAQERSLDVREYLERNPDAFVVEATNSSGASHDGNGSSATRAGWSFTLFAPGARALSVTADQTLPAEGPPSYHVRVAEAEPPEDAPEAFALPDRAVANVTEFVERAAGHGFRAGGTLQTAFPYVRFDGAHARYHYALPLATGGRNASAENLSLAWGTSVLVLSETGRLVDLWTDEAGAEEILRRPDAP